MCIQPALYILRENGVFMIAETAVLLLLKVSKSAFPRHRQLNKWKLNAVRFPCRTLYTYPWRRYQNFPLCIVEKWLMSNGSDRGRRQLSCPNRCHGDMSLWGKWQTAENWCPAGTWTERLPNTSRWRHVNFTLLGSYKAEIPVTYALILIHSACRKAREILRVSTMEHRHFVNSSEMVQ